MISKADFLKHQRQRLETILEQVRKEFYYLESSELRYRESEGKWNILETFEHMNLVNGYYLKNIGQKLNKMADGTPEEKIPSDWLGRKIADSMKPKGRKISLKMKTFRKIDPVRRQKAGIAIVENVVFQNFINDMEEMDQLLELALTKRIKGQKVPTFFPWLKISLWRAFDFAISHAERHVVQAQNIADRIKK